MPQFQGAGRVEEQGQGDISPLYGSAEGPGDEAPNGDDPLRPYRFHGLSLREDSARGAIGDCPFCGKEDKFSVSPKDGRWRCWVCGDGSSKGGGNLYTFLNLLWKRSDEATGKERYKELTTERGLLLPETLSLWGACVSTITGEWLIPGFNSKGKLVQLYRYLRDTKTGKRRLLPTPTIAHGIFGMPLIKKTYNTVFYCESFWDGAAAWEVLRAAKNVGDGDLETTASETSSMLGKGVVLASPGCNVFREDWISLMAGKQVVLLTQSDHPPKSGNVGPASLMGMKRVATHLVYSGTAPDQLLYLKWGEEGYDPALPSGYDIRDRLREGKDLPERVAVLKPLLERVVPIPADWAEGRSNGTVAHGGTEIECKHCDSWEAMVSEWRNAMCWIEGLDRALSVIFACIVSTRAVGDPLWCKLIGSPSCGKSTLCEAVSINKKYVKAVSKLTGIHSGWKSDRDGSTDNGLIPLIADKTLIVKDADTLLQSDNLLVTLSELRDLYDGTTRSFYKHGIDREYKGIRTTVVLSGTHSIRKIDSSVLGERFIDCVIEKLETAVEEDILRKVARRASESVGIESNGSTTQHHPAMLKAMQLTGGYVGYLRTNAARLLAEVSLSLDYEMKCIQLGLFVAHLRARPTESKVATRQDESYERELAPRLVAQLIRLAKCMAVVLNKNEVDKEVMRRVRQCAFDTARGRTLDLAKTLWAHQATGLTVEALSMLEAHDKDKVEKVLRFMRQLEVVEFFSTRPIPGIANQPRWRLTQKFAKLYAEVMHA